MFLGCFFPISENYSTMIKQIIAPLLMALLPYNLSAQKSIETEPNFTEGYVIYELKSNGKSELSEFFRETTLTLYIKDGKSKLDLKIMGGFAEMQLVVNQKDEKHVVLLNIPMLSEKVNIPINETDLTTGQTVNENINQMPFKPGQIEYFYKDRTTIAGKKCYKAIAPVAGYRSKALLYLSKKFRINTPEFISKYVGDLPGLPLYTEMNFSGLKIQLKAIEIRRTKISDQVFQVPEGYKSKTFNELKKEMADFNGNKNKDDMGL
jgi:hypothetical protein